MSEMPPCPKCQSPYVYEDGALLICPECAHEWAAGSAGAADADDGDAFVVRDAHGTVLADGDSVTLIKDLKLKGSSGVIKMGTKVKNIRLVDSDHNIDCKIPGVGAIGLKSEFVKVIPGRAPPSLLKTRIPAKPSTKTPCNTPPAGARIAYYLLKKTVTMSEMPPCPKCQSPYVYEDGALLICPECAHEWAAGSAGAADADDGDAFVVRDAHGTVLADGDSVTLIKDLKLKGSSGVIKMGTKVKNIRLVDSDHNIDCKIPGVGAIGLKSEFVKKAAD